MGEHLRSVLALASAVTAYELDLLNFGFSVTAVDVVNPRFL
jgi:hypothetical protein